MYYSRSSYLWLACEFLYLSLCLHPSCPLFFQLYLHLKQLLFGWGCRGICFHWNVANLIRSLTHCDWSRNRDSTHTIKIVCHFTRFAHCFRHLLLRFRTLLAWRSLPWIWHFLCRRVETILLRSLICLLDSLSFGSSIRIYQIDLLLSATPDPLSVSLDSWVGPFIFRLHFLN